MDGTSKYMKNKIKLYIFSLLLALFFGITFDCGAAYSEANLEASELDASTTAQIENFYNKLEDGKLGEDMNGITDANALENSFNFEDYFDYNKIHFWILLVSVVLIFLILINLFKKLGEMKTQMDEYRKKVFTDTRDDVYQTNEKDIKDKDEIEDEEIENNDDFEEEEIEENITHPHLHIEVESDDDVVDDVEGENDVAEDVFIDDEDNEEEIIIEEKKTKSKKEKLESKEDVEEFEELKELELEDDDDEEILYN